MYLPAWATNRENELKRPFLNRIELLADSNKDRSLSHEEWNSVYTSLGKQRRPEYLFRKYGPDGGLSLDDLKRYVSQVDNHH